MSNNTSNQLTPNDQISLLSEPSFPHRSHHIIVDDQQLLMIQRAIKMGLESGGLLEEKDEWDNDVGQGLVDMIEDTVHDPDYKRDMVHGFVI